MITYTLFQIRRFSSVTNICNEAKRYGDAANTIRGMVSCQELTSTLDTDYRDYIATAIDIVRDLVEETE